MELPALSNFTPHELLRLYGAILDDLQTRGVVRTNNSPMGDYTEWLVSTRLCLKLAENSEKGFNATNCDGLKYEIKARRVTPSNISRQLGAIRDLDGQHFDYLVAVVYDKSFSIILALKIPRSIVVAKSKFVENTNSYMLHANDSLRDEPGVEDIAHLLR